MEVMWKSIEAFSRGKTRRRSMVIAGFAFAVMLLAPAPRAGAATGDCGVPLGTAQSTVTDCLFILGAAVQIRQCEPCVCDVNLSGGITASDALLCLRFAVGQDVVLGCPPCAGCPGFVEWTTRAGLGEPCETNDQCASGTCDTDSGRCLTATEIDLGWRGTAHNVDLNEGSVLRLRVACDGEGAGCGECEIEGIDPSVDNCRCANDTRAICDSPFVPDAANCPACSGGAFPGKACAGDAQCAGGPCATYCAFDPELECATNGDCPKGRKLCDEVSKCGDGDGTTCSAGNDCIGACTAASTCECYDSPPQPVASVEFPFCVVPRLTSDVSGTVDVDSGGSVLVKDLQLRAYIGLNLSSPCPVCGGTCTAAGETLCSTDDDCGQGDTCRLDPVPGDGIRGGSCVGGAHEGQTCDVGATNASFPARDGGGGYSLDCMPESKTGFTGSGLRVRDIETTGTSSLPATLPCDPRLALSDLCPCLVCSGTSDVACNDDGDCALLQSCSELPEQPCDDNDDCSDFDLGTCTTFDRCTGSTAAVCSTNADCESVDFGTCGPATCSSRGSGIVPKPNSCAGGLCDVDEDGEGSCSSGPDDKFCDGLLKADGSGIRFCSSNDDCSAVVVGFDAGLCTLVERRACFGDPIVAEGAADALDPRAVATFCVPPTMNIGASTSIGLPGPARIRRQSGLEAFCASDPATLYVPGSDACPP